MILWAAACAPRHKLQNWFQWFWRSKRNSKMICHGNRFSKNIRFIHEANDGKRIVKSGTLRSSFYVDTHCASASAKKISNRKGIDFFSVLFLSTGSCCVELPVVVDDLRRLKLSSFYIIRITNVAFCFDEDDATSQSRFPKL